LTETNGHSFLRRPGPTKGCRANDDYDDDTGELSVYYGSGWNWLRIVTVAGCGINSVEPSGSVSSELVI
jgi:hypothetical protein